ncbi:MAG: TetR/AcrR family transcriptional regulator [Chitinispirillaceae bacterium]|nr:TetR/AcrR family transcriptional regulator [Chitinispirillaceae bacterium]
MAKRIIKEYEKRRNEIFDAAKTLFFKRGYENTTVETIIDSVGISKGTFYYYFKSKEELLDALAHESAKTAFEKIDSAVFGNRLNALERMRLYFQYSRSWKLDNRDMLKALMKVLYTPSNLLLREKFMEKQIELLKPTLTRIIRQGIDEGLFHTPYPDDIAEILFSLFGNAGTSFSSLVLTVDEHPENIDVLLHKFKVYQDLFERILGAPEGSIEFVDRKYLKKYFFINNTRRR